MNVVRGDHFVRTMMYRRRRAATPGSSYEYSERWLDEVVGRTHYGADLTLMNDWSLLLTFSYRRVER